MTNKITFLDLKPSESNFANDVANGLANKPASVPPKYFYDELGSQLFDDITKLDEYYPTRTELTILKKNIKEIADIIGTNSVLVEPGGGSCTKIDILLNDLKPKAYVPMDISSAHLKLSSETLAKQYEGLEVHAVCTDFTRNMYVPDSAPEGTRVVFFPGSSIGNFTPSEAHAFLRSIAQLVCRDGYFLIGVDLKKDTTMLEAAYDDAEGLTAQFNLNVLARMNKELGANFELDQWQHKALYNEELGRIEMHLISRFNQSVMIDGQRYHFRTDETIHTENSYKYSIDEFIELAEKANFKSKAVWQDENELFSVHLFQSECIKC